MGGWGWGKIEIKDHLSPAEAEIEAELGNIRLKIHIVSEVFLESGRLNFTPLNFQDVKTNFISNINEFVVKDKRCIIRIHILLKLNERL